MEVAESRRVRVMGDVRSPPPPPELAVGKVAVLSLTLERLDVGCIAGGAGTVRVRETVAVGVVVVVDLVAAMVDRLEGELEPTDFLSVD